MEEEEASATEMASCTDSGLRPHQGLQTTCSPAIMPGNCIAILQPMGLPFSAGQKEGWKCPFLRQKLNLVSKFDAYPMPHVDEVLESEGPARFISTLDLAKGPYVGAVKRNCIHHPVRTFSVPCHAFWAP